MTAGPATTILGQYPLSGGRLLVNFTRPGHVGWAVVLPGTQIGQEPLTLGGEVRNTLTIRPPEPSTGAEARLAAQDLAASGWTEDAQLALLDLVGNGTPPLSAIDQVRPQWSSTAAEGDPFEAGCAYDSLESNDVAARGCYRRYWGDEDEDDAYAGATSYAYAQTGNPQMVLTIVTTAHSYGNAKMLEYNPLRTVNQGDCSTVNLGINLYGMSVSQSQQVCPEKLEPTIYSDGTVYGVDWRGRATSGSRYTELVEAAHVKKGPAYAPAPSPKEMGFAYHMDFRTEPAGKGILCGQSSTMSANDYCDPTATPKRIVHEILEG